MAREARISSRETTERTSVLGWLLAIRSMIERSSLLVGYPTRSLSMNRSTWASGRG
jgi:hypothetical protein